MDHKTLPAALILWLTLAALPTSAAEPMPIFDAHMHYSRSAWNVFDAKAVVRKMDTAGVTGALVSSTPDDGTLALARAAPARFVPELRPYRTPGDMMRWPTAQCVIVVAWPMATMSSSDRPWKRSISRSRPSFSLSDRCWGLAMVTRWPPLARSDPRRRAPPR